MKIPNCEFYEYGMCTCKNTCKFPNQEYKEETKVNQITKTPVYWREITADDADTFLDVVALRKSPFQIMRGTIHKRLDMGVVKFYLHHKTVVVEDVTHFVPTEEFDLP